MVKLANSLHRHILVVTFFKQWVFCKQKGSPRTGNRTRTNTHPGDTEANTAGKGVRACGAHSPNRDGKAVREKYNTFNSV